MTPSEPPALPPGIAQLSFEEAYQRLKSITAELEGDRLPLEESLKAYEEAMQLAQRCQELLQAAEERITVLQNGGYQPLDIEISD